MTRIMLPFHLVVLNDNPYMAIGFQWIDSYTGVIYPHHITEYAVLDLAEEVWESFPTCYTAQKNEFILPLWRFHQKVGAKRLLNSL